MRMPELPDVVIYIESLARRIAEETLLGVRIRAPFLLRTVDPSPDQLAGLRVRSVGRMGKRIAIALDDDIHIVIHLMIAGRLQWKPPMAPINGRIDLAAFDFERGTLVLTEAGTTRRASLHLVRGADALKPFDRGGLELLTCTPAQFRERLRMENHTLKRALTDPRLFSGIGNAYSDEILHRARLSPVQTTSRLSDDDIAKLFAAAQQVLVEWTERLRVQTGEDFPAKVTAFRDGMAVHGRFGKPCPDCGSLVQRIRYASNETNYCARCQTGGRLLADRALSRILREDWPRSIDELT
jgi:formamidopyrimidine-DNA glycosylase